MYICIRKGVLAKSEERTIFFTSEKKKKCPIRIAAYEVFHMCQEWYVQSKATTVREFCAKFPAFYGYSVIGSRVTLHSRN